MEEPPRAEDGAMASTEEGSPTELVEDSENTVLAPPNLTSAMPDGWRPQLGEVPSVPIERVHSLGDLHGWAPGLITYLIENQLATVEVNDRALYRTVKGGRYEPDEANLRAVFPEPIRYFEETGDFPTAGLKGQWLDYNWRKTKPEGHYSVKAEWVCEDPGTAFVQIGDVFDRSDHSELACEILRQLIIQAPLRVFVLVGNHEQFFLEKDKMVWLHNEKRWEYSKDRGLESQGFQTRTYRENSDEVYFLYSCSTSLLYLTQGAIMEFAKNGGEVEDWILEGGFEDATSAYKIISNKKKGEKIQGAIVTLLLGHTIFAHAEPNAFMNDRTSDTVLSRLRDGVLSVNKTRMALDEYEVGNSIQDSLHSALLWSRGAEVGITDPTPLPFKAIESMRRAIAVFPGLRHYIHGHSPVVNSRLQPKRTSNPVSYLARRLEAPNPEVGSVRIHMIDSGICPVYHHGDQGIFDPSRVPVGLGLTAALVAFQNPKDEKVESAESDSKLWLVNHTADDSTEVFTIPPSLIAMNPTKIGSLDKGGVRVSMSDAWNEEGDRFQMEDGSVLIPSVKGLGKDNQIEFVICNGEVNYARALWSTEGERIEMDRAVLHPIPIDETMTGGLDAIDSRLSHADPNQWFEVLQMLRVRLGFRRGALLLDASSSMDDSMHLHISSLSQNGFSEIVEILPRTRLKRKLAYRKSESNSKAAWFVGLGKSPSGTLSAQSSGWSGNYVDDVAGLKQVLNSEIGDVLRIVLKTNRLNKPPRIWEESESIIEEAEEGIVLAEPAEQEEFIGADDGHPALPPSPPTTPEQEKEPASEQREKQETPWKENKTPSSTSASGGVPFKDTSKRKSKPVKPARSQKYPEKRKLSRSSRTIKSSGSSSSIRNNDDTKSSPKEKTKSGKKTFTERIAKKLGGAFEEVIDVIIPDEKPKRATEGKARTYPKRDVEQRTVSDGDLISVEVSSSQTKYNKHQLFERFPHYCRLDDLPREMPANKVLQYFKNWTRKIRLEVNSDFIGMNPSERQGCALRVRGDLPQNCEKEASTNKLTIRNRITGDKLVFKITYYIFEEKPR